MPRLKAVAALSLATLLTPAVFLGQNANPAKPGTLNYVEGQVSLDGQPVKSAAVGTAAVDAGQDVETQNGKAEVLLTPGVFLRLGSNSEVTMVSPDLTHTEVRLVRGEADVEVDQLFKQNRIVVDEAQDHTILLKTGLYDFDANTNVLRVFDGKAAVSADGLSGDGQKAEIVKGGHEAALAGEAGKPQDFDKKAAMDDLYNWGSLRSEYLGEANVQLASQYAGNAGFAPGWFWNSGFYGYTWLPGDGAFFNPYGFGFYSPYYLYGGGRIYGGFGGFGGYGRGIALRGPVASGAVWSGFSGGGFQGGAIGGGFHGGGGRR